MFTFVLKLHVFTCWGKAAACQSQELNSGYQTWRQSPLPVKLPAQPMSFNFGLLCVCVGGTSMSQLECQRTTSRNQFSPFHHVDSGNQTQVVKFDRKHLYPLSHNGRPLFTLNNEIMDNSFPNISVIYIHNKELLAKRSE